MTTYWQQGDHHPLTLGVQQFLFLQPDGQWGPVTNQAIISYQISKGSTKEDADGVIGPTTLGWMVNDGLSPACRALELIGYFEGACQRSDAWAYTSIIDDGAGKNYGVMQLNKFGSMQTIMKRYMPSGADFESWIGSGDGAVAQYKYFLELVWAKAWDFALRIGTSNLRTITMLCDAIVQGGDVWPSRPPQSYQDWRLSDEFRDAVVSAYKKYSVREAFFRSVRGAVDFNIEPGQAFAEIHPRSGNPTYLSDQLSRRRTIVDGEGVVHGDRYNLSDFGL
jgi:hypothetical protein